MNEKTSPSIVKLVAVLAVICIIVSAILGGVNMVTHQRIEDIQTEKTNAAFNAVLPTDGGYTQLEGDFGNGISGVYEADTGHVVQLTIGGAQSNITLAVGIDNDGVVSGVSIISHGETPGLGAKATEDSYRNQYIGAAEHVFVNKDGGTIQALTGATITSRAVSDAVNIAMDTVAALG